VSHEQEVYRPAVGGGRGVCQEIVSGAQRVFVRKSSSQILLKADADGPAWPDARIARRFDAGANRESLGKRLVTGALKSPFGEGERKKRATPPDGMQSGCEAKAKLIAMRLGKPAAGYGAIGRCSGAPTNGLWKWWDAILPPRRCGEPLKNGP